MTDDDLHVKEVHDADGHRVFVIVWIERCKGFLGSRAYLGWYLTFFLALNYILDNLHYLIEFVHMLF